MATLKAAMKAYASPIPPPRPPPLQEAGMVERALLAFATRAAGGPARAEGRALVLVLHLSRLLFTRLHHRRIARAIMEDAAQRMNGEVYSLRNQDLVLVVPPVTAVQVLSSQLAQLFRADVPDAAQLLSAWPASSGEMAAYASARQQDAPTQNRVDAPGQPNAAAEALAWIGAARLPDLTQRQIGVAWGTDGRLRPAFSEISVALPVLRSRMAALGGAEADPYLLRHIIAGLDRRMVYGVRPALVTPGMKQPVPLHLPLSIAGVLSDDFDQLAGLSSFALGIAIPLIDACADPSGFAAARGRIRALGAALVLDGVSLHAVSIMHLSSLDADWVKLEWAESLAGNTRLRDGLTRLGAARIVLTRTGTAAAAEWGMAHGVPYYQGQYIDSLLAAARVQACPASGHCVLRQCMERSYATGPAGRTGCSNPALLDAGAPV